MTKRLCLYAQITQQKNCGPEEGDNFKFQNGKERWMI